VEPLTRGLPPPDLRSLCPLSSTEFVEPPLEKNSWRNTPPKIKFLGKPLIQLKYKATDLKHITHLQKGNHNLQQRKYYSLPVEVKILF
jgi:hypothetical protein